MSIRTLALIIICSLCGAWNHADAQDSLDLGGGESIALSAVDAGTAILGSLSDQEGVGTDENRRVVRISQSFQIGITPVTRGQFARFVAVSGYRTEAEVGTSGGWGLSGGKLVQRKDFTWRQPGFAQDDRHPVVLVTWADAQAFCTWASKQSHRVVSLPTEAEWEYASRGGNEGTWNGSATPVSDGTRPVGADPANPLGLHDLLGHVNQWCQDWYQPVLPSSADDPRIDQAPAGDTARRCLRGGSFLQTTRQRVAARWRNSPGSRNADNGFRVVVRVSPPVAVATVTPRSSLVLPDVEATTPNVAASAPAPEPVRMPIVIPEPAFSGMPTFMVCFFVIFFLIVLIQIIRAVMRAVEGQDGTDSSLTRPRAPHQRPELRDDGFWLDTRPYRRGSRLRYRLRRNGAWTEEQVDITPNASRQFIYTGMRPEAVVIMDVSGGLAAGTLGRARRPRDDDDSFGSTSSSFPSAY